jgi:hypothetical protein
VVETIMTNVAVMRAMTSAGLQNGTAKRAMSHGAVSIPRRCVIADDGNDAAARFRRVNHRLEI